MVDDADQSTLPLVFTAEEAAERLKLTKRAVITHGKRHGLCAVFGRKVVFTEQQLVQLLDAMRYKPKSSIHDRHVSAYAAGQSSNWVRELLNKQDAERKSRQQERRDRLAREREARRQKEAMDREVRLQVKRQASIAKREAKFAKAQQKKMERLDEKSRDPSYWTPERKRQFRQGRMARLNEVGSKPDAR